MTMSEFFGEALTADPEPKLGLQKETVVNGFGVMGPGQVWPNWRWASAVWRPLWYSAHTYPKSSSTWRVARDSEGAESASWNSGGNFEVYWYGASLCVISFALEGNHWHNSI